MARKSIESAATAKEAVTKKAATKKAATKKAATKKAAGKKSDVKAEKPAKAEEAAKEEKKADAKVKAAGKAEKGITTHFFEIDGEQISTADIEERIREAYKADGHRIGNIKEVSVYYNFAERRAYYVVNGKPEDKFVEF